MASIGLAGEQYQLAWTSLIDMDSTEAIDTAVTMYLTVNTSGLPSGQVPDDIVFMVYVNDTTYSKTPSNTATIRLQAFTVVNSDSTWYDIVNFDKDSDDYGTSVINFENLYYTKMRAIVASNTGNVRVMYGLKRTW